MGRPKKATTQKSVLIAFSLDRALLARIERARRRHYTTRSGWLQRAAVAYLESAETAR